MSSLASWLASREPAAPAPLSQALSMILAERSPGRPPGTPGDGGAGASERGPTESLAAPARERLERALGRLGHDRDSAYRLLEADALFTYACEAALDDADRESSLRLVLTAASRPR